MDYYLKADTEEALWAALKAAGAATSYDVKDEDGNVVETRNAIKPEYALDIVGTIYKPTGNLIQQTVGEDVVEVPEMVALDGFHANLRGPIDLAPKVEYIPYEPSADELADPDFIMPAPTINTTDSPIKSILVDPAPKTPNRVWA